ncbi:hypothetical protein IUY40_02675 [Flavobacterium sp. ALJ2]|uniref:hypothetical protein n=1 Tax=Flavobacterium sp. ALJ2 TaxID=2786960 RepID=UPI00189DA187|nr:hypothetical protein [Flavobacterium sp. ALJ2]MBF7090449.1 hypothetical protein [Flavobacterium sp. ALJ2]
MAYSKISILFNTVPTEGTFLNVFESSLGLNLNENFKDNRLGSGQVQLPVFIASTNPEESDDSWVGFISNFYRTSFNLDYNSTNLFDIVSIPGAPNSGIGEIIITAKYSGAVFILQSETIDATITINNEVVVPEIKILGANFTSAINNQCEYVNVNVSTDLLAKKVISPISVNPNADNPISFDWLRGQTINVIVEDANGKQASRSFVTPSILNTANFSFIINNSPNGATVVVQGTSTSGLVLQYSLNNINWQLSDTFSGLGVGNFTLYVKDQLGCSFIKPFYVDEFGIQNSYLYISKSNPIRYAKRITWGDSDNYKNDENTLSCEVDVDEVYKEVQQFQSADIINTQFKSNFTTNIAQIIKEDLTVINIPVEKKTSNIGIKDKRDARKYSLGNGKTGIYFISGNTYDYNNNVITGSYSLIGNLPEWGIIGNYIVINNAWFLIEEIVFDENKNADILIFSQNYYGPEINIIVGSIFNRFNYEVYEFSISMFDFVDKYFKVKLINSDPNFSTITHISEEIWCKVKHEDLIEIRYFNTTNTDVFYSTGIEFKLRIPLTSQKGILDEESEIHKTDTDAILLSADFYEGDQFIFEPVTKEIWRKIMIALSHEKVWLNGVGYVKNGSFSTEGPLENSNLYVLTANMIKTGSVYNSSGSGNIDFDGSQVEIPGLISTESGYVSY